MESQLEQTKYLSIISFSYKASRISHANQILHLTNFNLLN